jgi:hypothetical protein
MPSFFKDDKLSNVSRTIPSIEFSIGITATMSSEFSSFNALITDDIDLRFAKLGNDAGIIGATII